MVSMLLAMPWAARLAVQRLGSARRLTGFAAAAVVQSNWHHPAAWFQAIVDKLSD
jgi:hypothetical protein